VHAALRTAVDEKVGAGRRSTSCIGTEWLVRAGASRGDKHAGEWRHRPRQRGEIGMQRWLHAACTVPGGCIRLCGIRHHGCRPGIRALTQDTVHKGRDHQGRKIIGESRKVLGKVDQNDLLGFAL
jgi:hypothetical protein